MDWVGTTGEWQASSINLGELITEARTRCLDKLSLRDGDLSKVSARLFSLIEWVGVEAGDFDSCKTLFSTEFN